MILLNIKESRLSKWTYSKSSIINPSENDPNQTEYTGLVSLRSLFIFGAFLLFLKTVLMRKAQQLSSSLERNLIVRPASLHKFFYSSINFHQNILNRGLARSTKKSCLSSIWYWRKYRLPFTNSTTENLKKNWKKSTSALQTSLLLIFSRDVQFSPRQLVEWFDRTRVGIDLWKLIRDDTSLGIGWDCSGQVQDQVRVRFICVSA